MRATLHRYIVFGGLILGFASLASANTSFSFDFTQQSLGQSSANSGGSLTMTSGALTVIETAYWVNANNSGASVTGTSNTFARTWLGAFSGNGLGVCNTNEQTNCGLNNQHQVDSLAGLDFISLAFTSAIDLNDIKVQSYGNPTGGTTQDVDVSYAWLSATQEAALTAGTLVFSTVNFNTLTSTDLTSKDYSGINAQFGQYLLIGTAVTAQYGGDGHVDAFKLQGIGGSTPEPATFVLIGSGLLAGALIRRRRKA